ncbi:tRNA (5-methylaminomethyl-2-thiouridine)(34)-methyltransferase MnmD [Paenalcaligenes niemegkensis]|uniref:tRNA (5-methylaminomethyl-2-thiouridine)(34)-methyltransferase MnmD n=1 Tax=Paenalcaligenes niemegkensis TaxID=2895469 RepID=UPI001EE92851|nr:tRNA (5-methylaminomethyl-2-thiouridine)(34)-methyltransferase MnmD [Paenalcaligenes niemegkensis]MCQ9615904.1 tRNA (5-methylaminomethyl-2-thiouridine)(34)-methyltransferase MnmD [Paenalcaligenes niemegkensis]
MTARFQPLIAAQPGFNESGIAQSQNYDDVYHSAAGALAQAEHVFLGGNHLPLRWQHQDSFTICETGFGLGNNFLATWARWREDDLRCTRLHYLAFEAHPFNKHDLRRMLDSSPLAIQPLVEQLVKQWPELLPGIHRLSFEAENLTLTLVFGDISQKAKLVNAKVNAFYLDGFSPRVNPEMWSRRLFGQLVRLSAFGATAASWCCAGQVRRDLRDAGFVVEKAPGFASKREMMRAQLRPNLGSALRVPPACVTVVGAGIAGAATAAALARRGIDVKVLDPVLERGNGASHQGHRALAMTPIVTSDDAPRARLSRAGLLLAKRYWQESAPGACHRAGTITAATTREDDAAMKKAVLAMGFPQSWVHYADAGQLSELLGSALPFGGLVYPQATLADPEMLISGLLSLPRIHTYSVQVHDLMQQEGGWQLNLHEAGTAKHAEWLFAECVVLCNAISAPAMALKAVPHLHATRFMSMMSLPGQVSFYDNTDFQLSPSVILAGDGYLLPALDGVRVGGSTYGHATDEVQVTQAGHQHIQDILGRWRSQLKAERFRAIGGWAGQRAATSDRLPVFAQGAEGLWLNSGYGSNGFSWAALCAEELAAQLCNEPGVLERDLSRAIGLR